MPATSPYDDTIEAAAREWNVDPVLLKAVMLHESEGNPGAVSKAGARGLMQIMPDTGRTLGMTDLHDPTQSIYAGAKYLSQALDAEGSPDKALLYYHGGPEWRTRYGPESAGYVPAVAARYAALAPKPAAAPDTKAAPNASPGAPKVTDDEFLKSTGATFSGSPTAPAGKAQKADAVPADDDFLKASGAAAVPGKAPAVQVSSEGFLTAAPQSKAGEQPPADTSSGFDVSLHPPPGAGRRVIEAARQGWEAVPRFGTQVEGDREKLDSLPYGVGRFILAPAGDIITTAAAAGNALFRGGQQFIAESVSPVSPALGRDLAAMPEAFAGSPGQFHPLEPPTTRIARAEADRPLLSVGPRPLPPVTLDELTGAIRRADEVAPPPDLPPSAGGRAAEPNPLNQPDAAAAPRPAAAEPRAAGAEATTEPIPPKTRGQEGRDYDAVAEQTAEQRAQSHTKPGAKTPTLYDETPYVTDVPGGTLPPRIYAERDFDPQTALDHKVSYGEDPAYRAAVDKRTRDRNDGMSDLLKQDAGDKRTLEVAEEHRAEVSPRELGVFAAEKPVDVSLATGLQKRVSALLTGPESKRGPIRTIIKDVADTLLDADGNLETQPSAWYGARKNVADLLKKGKGVGEVADNVRAVKSILEGLLPDIDEVIKSGAPKYEEFMREWHARSQVINQQTFLQQYLPTGPKSLYDKDGYLQFNRLNQMIKDIGKERSAKGVANAKALTQEQIDNVIAVRNELAAKSLRERMEKVGGSPTAQILEAQAKRGQGVLGKVAQAGADMALHTGGAVLASHGVPGVNAAVSLYQTVGRPMREARKLRQRQEKAAAEINALKSRLLSDQPVNPLNPP